MIMVIKMNEYKSINEVCKMLDITSRTIRYYEELGLISTIRDSKTAPRKLDSNTIVKLKKICFLRQLGLQLDEIAQVIDDDAKAAEMMLEKTAMIEAEMAAMAERICKLEKVLAIAAEGGNIYSAASSLSENNVPEENLETAAEVTRLLLEERYSELSPYFGNSTNSFPDGFVEKCWKNHIKPCGRFICIEEPVIDGTTIISRLRCEKVNIAIKMEICQKTVMRIMLQYYNKK
ncbi:MAG: HTH-type transcriptional activator TipA [Firmicutes bacterium ADurb.BinA205]|nr:MAG: HTH-type transcriptional activator TipA [Firmicutes bacterium ADurb.BinA205]